MSGYGTSTYGTGTYEEATGPPPVPPPSLIAPHFASPLQVTSHAAVIEQDSDQDLLQSVATLLRTPVGSRDELPDYGVPDLPFRTDAGEIDDEILAAIRQWEPRVEALSDTEIDDLVATVEVTING